MNDTVVNNINVNFINYETPNILNINQTNEGVIYGNPEHNQLRMSFDITKPKAWFEPISVYTAGQPILRGQVVSIAFISDVNESLITSSEPLIVPTNILTHDWSIGIALEPANVGDKIHILSRGKIKYNTLDTRTNIYIPPEEEEPNNLYDYNNIGKRIYVTNNGGLSLIQPTTGNIIIIGHLTDAPDDVVGGNIIAIEIQPTDSPSYNEMFKIVNTINSNISNTSNLANNAFNTANNAFNTANSAFDTANSAYNQANNAFGKANNAFNTANSAFDTANSAYNQANNAFGKANNAFNTANSAFDTANSAYNQANNAFGKANDAFDTANNAFNTANNAFATANSAYVQANNAFGKANNAFATANSAYVQANNAFEKANDAFDTANSAYVQANNAFGKANNAFNTANNAFNTANSAYVQANNAFGKANNAFNTANSAFDIANNAFDTANSAYDISIKTIMGTSNGNVTIPVYNNTTLIGNITLTFGY